MTPEERGRKFEDILNVLDRALQEYRDGQDAAREASRAIRAAVERMEASQVRIEDMNAATNKAVDAMLVANRAALALFRDEKAQP
jgi:20S proteasome alpha/beta subunit